MKKVSAKISGKKGKPSKEGFLSLIESQGASKEIVKAFSEVKPDIFFDRLFKDKFYGEESFPIMYGQKSDNFVLLARMISLLGPQKGQRILEIGTGTGYSTAVLSKLCREVVSIDINEKLAASAKERLYENDFGNIRFFAGDGTTIEDDFGSIDGVLIHAACRKRPLAVMKNLAFGGRVVYPMGPAHFQQIIVMTNMPDPDTGGNFKIEYFDEGVFSLVKGPYGYDNVVLPKEFGEEVIDADEKEPPKSLESNDFLFVPTKSEDDEEEGESGRED
jgi:protein-L-isoaspartate(D-aspartate) O-methyltransferase